MPSSRRRPYRKPTPERLENIAVYYLSRYAASEESLRRVLENRLRRAKIQDEAFAADHEAQATLRCAIDKIIEKHKNLGALDDAAFAAMKVRSLRRSGSSARRIALYLSQKGVKKDDIASALSSNEDEGGDSAEQEEEAARAFARRRGLGPYRKAGQGARDAQAEAKVRAKEIASLARAGYSYDTAKRVLGAQEEEF